MNFATPVNYRYAMNLKLSQIHGEAPTAVIFPSVEDIVFSSREFKEFDEAVNSANMFVSEMTRTVNVMAKLEKYKMISEVNPKFTGKETISKDWDSNEVAKLWIIDALRHEKFPGPMLAVGLTQILEVPQDMVPLM
jgi:hypothetical protein